MSKIHDDFFPQFEKMGELEVRRKMECCELQIMQQEPAKAWLRLKDAERSASGGESVRWARHAAWAAYAAALMATIGASSSIKNTIVWFVSLFSK